MNTLIKFYIIGKDRLYDKFCPPPNLSRVRTSNDWGPDLFIETLFCLNTLLPLEGRNC